jgi:hypothetical protein
LLSVVTSYDFAKQNLIVQNLCTFWNKISNFGHMAMRRRCHCYAKVNGTLIIKLTQPFPLFHQRNVVSCHQHGYGAIIILGRTEKRGLLKTRLKMHSVLYPRESKTFIDLQNRHDRSNRKQDKTGTRLPAYGRTRLLSYGQIRRFDATQIDANLMRRELTRLNLT